jgi:hypothetical protein
MYFEAIEGLRASDPNSSNDLRNKYEKQKLFFFERRINNLSIYNLTDIDRDILWGFFLAAEQEKSDSEKSSSYCLLSSFKNHKIEDEQVDDSLENHAIIGWLRIYWSKAWRKFAELNKYSLAAKYVLKKQKDLGDDKASYLTAEKDLIDDLKQIYPKAEKSLNLPVTASVILFPVIDKDGILDLDNAALDFLKQYNNGKYTSSQIDALKSRIENIKEYDIEARLDVWDNPLFFIRLLATCRWIDIIRRYVSEKLENPPALSYQFSVQILKTKSKGTKLNEAGNMLVDSSGKNISSFDKSAYMPVEISESIIRSNVPLLNSVTSSYVLRWLPTQAHKQHFLNIKNPNTMVIEGGYRRLGELSGAGNTDPINEKIKKIISLLSGCGYRYEGKNNIVTGNLLFYEHSQARGRNSSTLTITLAQALCPGFVDELPKGNSKYKLERLLVPVVAMPTFIGRANEHGAQANFQDAMLIEMRLRAAELYERGGILLNNDSLRELAAKAKMPISLIPKVISHWIAENYLEKIEDCVLNLGPRYPEARAMLLEAGEKVVKGSIAGKKRKAAIKRRYMGKGKSSDQKSSPTV